MVSQMISKVTLVQSGRLNNYMSNAAACVALEYVNVRQLFHQPGMEIQISYK